MRDSNFAVTILYLRRLALRLPRISLRLSPTDNKRYFSTGSTALMEQL